MGLVTALAIGGRRLVGWTMPAEANRRLTACLGYAVQLAGRLHACRRQRPERCAAHDRSCAFRRRIWQCNLSPPLIAQVEFVKDDVPRVVGLIVGISQGGYAFAPALFGLIRALAPPMQRTRPPAQPRWFLWPLPLSRAWQSPRFLPGADNNHSDLRRTSSLER